MGIADLSSAAYKRGWIDMLVTGEEEEEEGGEVRDSIAPPPLSPGLLPSHRPHPEEEEKEHVTIGPLRRMRVKG